MSEKEQDRNTTLDPDPTDEAPEAGAEELTADEPTADVPTADQPGTDAPGADQVTLTDPAAQLETVTAERDQFRDQLLRRQADFENYRRRMENERADFARYAGMGTVRELLPVLDDLERAILAAPRMEGAGSEFVKGIEIIYQRFLDILRKAGLEPIESVGKPFDPNVHHAVDSVESEDVEDHTVLEEWQKGYNFKGRLLREAMVRVAVRPADSSGATDSE